MNKVLRFPWHAVVKLDRHPPAPPHIANGLTGERLHVTAARPNEGAGPLTVAQANRLARLLNLGERCEAPLAHLEAVDLRPRLEILRAALELLEFAGDVCAECGAGRTSERKHAVGCPVGQALVRATRPDLPSYNPDTTE